MRLFWQLTVLCTIAMWADSALAQRRPIADETLGSERAIVTPSNNLPVPGDRISGGARRGDNLFHSFREFGIDPGRSVYFEDPGVRNILSRVTGGNPSEIFGRLGVLGNANLFLINPSGIIFGAGASLDVNGSFVGTTANAIQFGNQGFFNASDPNAPPLLTVQPSAFLFNQTAAQPIQPIVNRSIAPLRIDGLGDLVIGLRVPNGRNLVLLGGNVINRGTLSAFGGRIELGSVGGTGTVELNADSSLSFPNRIARADVLITNSSLIDATSNGGGDIIINARNIDILDGSLLQSGIVLGSAKVESQAGNIVLNGTGEIQVRQSGIINNVNAGGIGRGGNIDITTGSLFLDGAELQALTRGQGNAGSVIIHANDRVVFDNSIAFNTVGDRAFKDMVIGNGGNIEIDANSLEVVNGAQLQASTFGQGNAGDVIIHVRDRVVFDGTTADGKFFSTAFSTVGDANFDSAAEGNGGKVEIDTNSLEVTNGAQLQASTFGQGNAGDVIIHALDRVVFDGTSADGEDPSAAFSRVGARGIGMGGSINIDTNSLVVRDGARLVASTFGQGRAGNVIIHADDRVLFDNSDAFSSVEEGGLGSGGNISINTNSLVVRNGASLTASTLGRGRAGNIQINADTVSLEGVGSDGASSGLFALTFARATRRGGEITIDADAIHLINGAVVNAQTFNDFRGGDITLNANTFEATGGGQIVTTTLLGSGRAGNINLNVTDHITLSGSDRRGTSGLFANTGSSSSGRGGTIRITTGQLEVSDRASVVVNSQGSGVAGDIDITAQSVQLDRGDMSAETSASANGGNIRLRDVDLLQLRNRSRISTTAGTRRAGGNGGNITFDSGFIVAVPNENSDIRANAFSGKGGTVDITSEGIFGIKERETDTNLSDITASSELGVQGDININTPNVDPSQGLVQLPIAPIDASNQIAQRCPINGDVAGEFVITGRGGVPSNPAEILGGATVLSDLAEIEGEGQGSHKAQAETSDRTAVSPSAKAEIVEAQGWVMGADGKVRLTTDNPAVEPHRAPIAPVLCPRS